MLKRAMTLISENKTMEVALETVNDFEERVDPNELRMRINDSTVYEVCEAVKSHAHK